MGKFSLLRNLIAFSLKVIVSKLNSIQAPTSSCPLSLHAHTLHTPWCLHPALFKSYLLGISNTYYKNIEWEKVRVPLTRILSPKQVRFQQHRPGPVIPGTRNESSWIFVSCLECSQGSSLSITMDYCSDFFLLPCAVFSLSLSYLEIKREPTVKDQCQCQHVFIAGLRT